jgi:hypothetical protein
LRWSRRAVIGQLGFAEDLIVRLPAVYAAFAEGRIDWAKARAFTHGLADLDQATARAVAERLLPKAPGWTCATLREKLAYHLRRADPDTARDRYRRSVAERRLYKDLNGDGTAQLAGVNLPPDRAAAAFDRIDALARAAQADGDARTLDQLRTDTYLDLLTGIAFAVRPSHDPYTADADTEAARADEAFNATGRITHSCTTTGPADPTDPDAYPDPTTPDETAADARADGAGRGPRLDRPVADADWLAQVGFTDAEGLFFTPTPPTLNRSGSPTGSTRPGRPRSPPPGSAPAAGYAPDAGRWTCRSRWPP